MPTIISMIAAITLTATTLPPDPVIGHLTVTGDVAIKVMTCPSHDCSVLGLITEEQSSPVTRHYGDEIGQDWLLITHPTLKFPGWILCDLRFPQGAKFTIDDTIIGDC